MEKSFETENDKIKKTHRAKHFGWHQKGGIFYCNDLFTEFLPLPTFENKPFYSLVNGFTLSISKSCNNASQPRYSLSNDHAAFKVRSIDELLSKCRSFWPSVPYIQKVGNPSGTRYTSNFYIIYINWSYRGDKWWQRKKFSVIWMINMVMIWTGICCRLQIKHLSQSRRKK